MFRWTEASVSCSNLSVAAIYKHTDSASSITRLQMMGGDEEPGEPGKYSPDIIGLTVLEDLGAGAASPGVALLKMPALVLFTTKSCNKPLVLSPSRGRGRRHTAVCHQRLTTLVPTPPPATNRHSEAGTCNPYHHDTTL
jgi:hypothetical protein